MERRFFLALMLTAAVILLTPRFFPKAPPPPPGRPARADSLLALPSADSVASPSPGITRARDTGAASPSAAPPRAADAAPSPAQVAGAGMTPAAETVWVRTPEAEYAFASAWPALLDAIATGYRSHRPEGGPVRLRDPDGTLIDFALVIGRDTLALAAGRFTATRDGDGVRWDGTVGPAAVRLAMTAVPNSYVVNVTGRVESPSSPAELLVRLPGGFLSQETDTLDDYNTLAYAAKPVRRDASRIGFGALDPGERDTIAGPVQWAVVKTKYFMVAALAPADSTAPGAKPFGPLVVTGGPRSAKVATRAIATLPHPLPGGDLRFELYAGPLEWRRLVAMGRDFDNANPYGGFMQGLVQPFATIVMRVLLWMKDTVKVSYGWVLVIFGVLVRLLLWPLNQSAMRTSMKMQRLHPEITAVQQRHAGDQARMQQEIMKVYRAHGMTPFSPLAGCLPMLLPMPVLFALFFVFQNTIEFRGVPFLWLPDISLKDPYYIIPIAMGLSMFLLSWIGMRGIPPTPQSKMMAYVFPVMLTVVFLNFASGLNLYYTVQNIAALPQQWLIARERSKSGPPAPPHAAAAGPAAGAKAPARRG